MLTLTPPPTVEPEAAVIRQRGLAQDAGLPERDRDAIMLAMEPLSWGSHTVFRDQIRRADEIISRDYAARPIDPAAVLAAMEREAA